jgi:hypothetical protein
MTPQHSTSPRRLLLQGCQYLNSIRSSDYAHWMHRSDLLIQVLTRSTSGLIKPSKFNQGIAPSLIRLVGDLFGKEAERETNIGDTKHVNKHIN